MLQLAISSLEPLTLNTLMRAVNFVLQNRDLYDSPTSYDFSEDGQVSENMGSEASQLRRLSSRTGGILETIATFSEEASADHNEQAPDSSISSRSWTEANASTHTVQFLHATAKEFIQAQRDQLLLGRVNPRLAGLGGYDFLFLCCASPEFWVRPIFNHMPYYLKMAELHDGDDVGDGTSIARFRILREITLPHFGRSDVKWLLSQKDGFFCSFLLQDMEGARLSNDYVLIIMAVAANAKKLVKHVLVRFSPQHRERICLLQVAAVAADLVPIEHQDRTGMIEILVSSGYPIDQEAILCTSDIRGDSKGTALQVVLARQIDSKYSEDTRLDIVRCLLALGSNVNRSFHIPESGYAYPTSPLSYCVENESASLVRLLLDYKATTDPEDFRALKPIDLALIRQDKAVIKALADHGCDRQTPSLPPSMDEAIISGVRQSMLMGSIGHPAVAVLSARRPDSTLWAY